MVQCGTLQVQKKVKLKFPKQSNTLNLGSICFMLRKFLRCTHWVHAQCGHG